MGKMIGGIFLIVGVSVGAGILALPVTTSTSGFCSSSLLLCAVWLLMTFCSFLVLEVNLWLPEGNNMISMAKATLGKPGELVAWVSYLLLLYSLLAAYISAGTDVLSSLLDLIDLQIATWLSSCLFLGLLGFVVYRGTQVTDYVNRMLVYTKLVAIVLLIFFITPHIKLSLLNQGQSKYLVTTLMVIITSFGFAVIVPSLRTYFKGNVKQLRLVILLGSLFPLGLYILWDLVILGSLPLTGEDGLLTVLHSGHTTSQLIIALHDVIGGSWVTSVSDVFSSVCVATSFLGVALSLSDFLADGLNIKKQGAGNLIVYGATFLPPLAVILFYPSAFIMALNYAGTFCVVLLAVLPCLMVWSGRYYKKIATGYAVWGGKPLLLLVTLVSFLFLLIGIQQEFGF